MTLANDRYAVIGNPVTHSRSPQIHAAFALQTGEALEYGRTSAPADGFAVAASTFFAEGGRGLNVTVPFKEEAWRFAAHGLSDRARLAGAVNTLWLDPHGIHGCNTDGVGLLRDLQRLQAPLHNARILLVGAGGAARGVIGPLLDAGCAQLHIVNRTANRAVQLLQDVAALTSSARLSAGSLQEAARPGGWDLVINATASSLSDAVPDLPWDGLWQANGMAYDMMYSREATPFLRVAQAANITTADGLGMLVEQAAESFWLWRGVKPATQPVLTALRALVDAGGDANTPLYIA